jgi:hypothetical protein
MYRSVRATHPERTRRLPGDDLIPGPVTPLTHAITIRRPPSDVWPWLVQMGAGSRAGWYSHDALDNGGQPSARRIVPELQTIAVGMVFPAAPDVTEGFLLLAFEPERFLVLGWPSPTGPPLVTWAFVLQDAAPGTTRLIVRVRAAAGYRFGSLPPGLARIVVPAVHFVMQRKQLVGIATRVECRRPRAGLRPALDWPLGRTPPMWQLPGCGTDTCPDTPTPARETRCSTTSYRRTRPGDGTTCT